MLGIASGSVKLVDCVVWLTTFMTRAPAALETIISPSESNVTRLRAPSAAACPATVVPRIPMLMTGVLTVMASGPD